MLERILIAGAGGQGVVLMGKLLASVAVDNTQHVTFFPAYGAEVRGGTSNCQIILSSDVIPSPVTDAFESMIIMNQASADRFLDEAVEGAILILNSSMCRIPDDVSVVAVRASERAIELGDVRVANLILLGAFMARKQISESANIESMIRVLLEWKREALIDLNIKAFNIGLECGSE